MPRLTRTSTIVLVALGLGLLGWAAPANAQVNPSSEDVTIEQDVASFTLSNGIVTAIVSRRNGDITSLKFHDVETLSNNSGHAGGYWSHDVTGGTGLISGITIDPKITSGERGEVSVKGISGGRKMGHGPGAANGGDFPADIEIRYCLGRGESGIYTYCIFDHQPGYPAATMTEARYCAKLANQFDWMSLDDKKSMLFPVDLHEGDKYIYTAVQYTHPVYGWSSTTQHTGFWFINPTVEYLSGGPTKVEFLCHRDTTQVAAPCIHNYWRSSHYGGADVDVGQDEHWVKVIGPFFIYVNHGSDQQSVFDDAKAQQAREAAKWPYDWVSGVDYPHKEQRATVSGKLDLQDPQKSGASLPNLMVGLTSPAYQSQAPGMVHGRTIDWQTDARDYEFWVRGDDDGKFTIPNVRPGRYTLHAFADGVLGELALGDITVNTGKDLDLGNLPWRPLRMGKQEWEIGIPNRNGSEFFKADDYADPDASLNYAKLFPNDVHYVIGQSDFRKDWYFQQVPHNEDPKAKAEPFYGVRTPGKATPFAISFVVDHTPKGLATLRLAICGTGTRQLNVTVNDKAAGNVNLPMGDGAITRHSIQGLWYERQIPFDASMMRSGTNTLTITVPAGPVNNGVIYDYLRLELDESGKPPATTQP